MPEVIQVTNTHDVQRVIDAANEDGHYVIAPTHYWVNRNNEVRGYFSAGIVPTCHFWMHSSSTPFESKEVIDQCIKIGKQFATATGQLKYGMIACQPTSPFFTKLERHFGFKPIVQNTTLFGKPL